MQIEAYISVKVPILLAIWGMRRGIGAVVACESHYDG